MISYFLQFKQIGEKRASNNANGFLTLMGIDSVVTIRDELNSDYVTTACAMAYAMALLGLTGAKVVRMLQLHVNTTSVDGSAKRRPHYSDSCTRDVSKQ